MGGGGPGSVSRCGLEPRTRSHDDVRDIGAPCVEWYDLYLAAAHGDRLLGFWGGDRFGLHEKVARFYLVDVDGVMNQGPVVLVVGCEVVDISQAVYLYTL